jgi:hypothetical protein
MLTIMSESRMIPISELRLQPSYLFHTRRNQQRSE